MKNLTDGNMSGRRWARGMVIACGSLAICSLAASVASAERSTFSGAATVGEIAQDAPQKAKPATRPVQPASDRVDTPVPTPRTAPVQNHLPPGGAIVFEEMALDFGKVSQTEELKGVFKFKNTGDKPLTIGSIKTSCGCTVAKLEKKIFAPGEGDEIQVTYKPKGQGKAQRIVTVATSDQSNPAVRLTVSAEVIPFLTIDPRNVSFGSVMNKSTHTKYVAVLSRDANMKVTDVTARGQFISAKLVEEETEEMGLKAPSGDLPGRAVIEVVLQPDAPKGYVRGNITVTALAAAESGEAQKQHNVNVLVSGQIVGDMKITPNFLRFAVLDKDEDFSGEVVISSRSGKPFKIVESRITDSNIEGLEMKVEPYKNGEVVGYRLVLDGNTGNHRGAFRGTVVLLTDLEEEGETEIRFMGAVRQPAVRPAAPNPGLQRPAAVPPAKPKGDTPKEQ